MTVSYLPAITQNPKFNFNFLLVSIDEVKERIETNNTRIRLTKKRGTRKIDIVKQGIFQCFCLKQSEFVHNFQKKRNFQITLRTSKYFVSKIYLVIKGTYILCQSSQNVNANFEKAF